MLSRKLLTMQQMHVSLKNSLIGAVSHETLFFSDSKLWQPHGAHDLSQRHQHFDRVRSHGQPEQRASCPPVPARRKVLRHGGDADAVL